MSRRERSLDNPGVIVGARAGEPVSDELAALVAELESNTNVRLMLDHAPDVPLLKTSVVTDKGPGARSCSSSSGGGHAGEKLPHAEERRDGAGQRIPAVIYRDKDDVKTILNMTWVLMIMAALLVASGAGNVFQYYRRPDRIVVDGSSGRVLSINDRNYGKEEGIEFGPDKLTNQDKLYVTREFVRSLYQIDPATRQKEIERALTMMVPDSAVRFARWMREKSILDQQRSESWQSTWNLMDIAVDANDPYTVNVIGKQDITRVAGGVAMKEAKQLRLTVKLVADSKGRADRNLRSGFLVSYLDYRELIESGATAGVGQPAPAAGVASGGDNPPVTPVSALQGR